MYRTFVDITTNVDDIERHLSEITDKSKLVMMRAMNRTASTIATTEKREVSARYFITQKNVAKTLRIEKASTSNLSARVVSKGERMDLAKFKVSPLRPVKVTKGGKRSPGVYKAAVRKNQGLKPLSGVEVGGKINKPFVAIMKNTKNDHMGMFYRGEKKEKKRRNARRKGVHSLKEPLKSVMGPSVPDVAGSKAVMEVVIKKANETLEKRIEHELSRVMQ